MVPCDDRIGRAATIRVTPPANGQGKGVRWAADYELGEAGEGTRTPGLRFTRALLYQLKDSGGRHRV